MCGIKKRDENLDIPILRTKLEEEHLAAVLLLTHIAHTHTHTHTPLILPHFLPSSFPSFLVYFPSHRTVTLSN